MSQQLQDLIDKIKKEGILEAQEQGRAIEVSARQKAEEIIEHAKSQAQEIITDAQKERQKLMDAAQMALKQVSRDMLLNLRKEIETMLRKIISLEIRRSLTPESLAAIIQQAVNGYLQHSTGNSHVAIVVGEQDFNKLKDGFIAELKEKLKDKVTLRSADNITAGFTISFDSGKSFFDFTDASLAEYLSGYLNVEVAKILKQAAKG